LLGSRVGAHPTSRAQVSRRSPSSERGLLLIETVAAMAIFVVISIALVSVLTAGILSQYQSHQKTLAEQLAVQEMERIRQLPYGSVGVTSGNPAGTLIPSEAITTGGLSAVLTREVRWVDDPTPTAYRTYADYKRVTLTIRRSSDSKVLVRYTTFLSPSDDASYGGTTNGTVKVQVVDMATNSPVQNVPVSIADGPSGGASDVTDASGTAIFPALLPNPSSGSQAYYDVTVTPPSGFVVLPDDLPTAPSSAAHLKVAAAATSSPVLRMYRPSTVYLNVTRFGLPYTGSATVTLSSSRGSTPYTFSGGTYTVPTGAVSGLEYTATATGGGVTSDPVTQTVPDLATYPQILTSTFDLALPNLTVTVKRKPSGSCTTVSNATVRVTGGPSSVDLTSDPTGSNGVATFAAPPGAGYTISATSSFGNKTLTAQTVLASPNPTGITVSVSGTCP
jgi:hypothetical protein